MASLIVGGIAGTNLALAEGTPSQKIDDAALLTKVKADLLQSGRVDGLDVNVDVKDGNVTLSGWATTDIERTAAAELAGKVNGVKSVENRIQVKTK
jgi:osmotically-inducible protein OsmY